MFLSEIMLYHLLHHFVSSSCIFTVYQIIHCFIYIIFWIGYDNMEYIVFTVCFLIICCSLNCCFTFLFSLYLIFILCPILFFYYFASLIQIFDCFVAHLLISSYVCLLLCLIIYLFMLCIYLFVNLFSYSFIYFNIYLFIYFNIYLFIYINIYCA